MTNTKYLAGVLAVLLPISASAQSLEWSAELGLNAAYSDGTCAFRRIRPLIPITCAHLFRRIRPPVTRCLEAVDVGYQV